MTDDEMWDRLGTARVGVLGTIRPDGSPHLVPFVFAPIAERRLVTAVDDKPKEGRRLARLRHIEGDPRVSVLVQHYGEDWSALWWVRADGHGEITDDAPPEWRRALTDEYHQYTEHELGPFVVITVERMTGWSAAEG